MTTENKDVDLELMDDEAFLKLDPTTLPVEEEEKEEEANEAPESDDVTASDDNPDTDSEDDAEDHADSESDDSDDADDDESESESDANDDAKDEDGDGTESTDESTEEPKGETKKVADKPDEKDAPKKDADKTGEKPDADGSVKDKAAPKVDAAEAAEFYTKVTATFRADGKDVTIRNADEAVRLMQMGVNYSRRMQELSPLRAMKNLLKEQGLDKPEDLNFMLDVKAGKPEAIRKLLKEHKIDPLDFDMKDGEEDNYVPTNHEPDVQAENFRSAIQDINERTGGPEFLAKVVDTWDDNSKNRLKESPAILEKLLDHESQGVYSKITDEIEHQKSLGYLGQATFLEAYTAVGEAMQKAGVLTPSTETKNDVSTSKDVKTPIDTGSRKVKRPTPDVSSASTPRSTKKAPKQDAEVDYAAMSDEDFLKVAPPT